MCDKEGREISEGHSNTYVENKMTNQWLQKGKNNRQTLLHNIQHRKLMIELHESTKKKNWG